MWILPVLNRFPALSWLERIGAPTTANDSRYVNYGPTFQFWVPPRKRRFLKQISGWFRPLALAEASCLASTGTMDYWFSFLTSFIILRSYSKNGAMFQSWVPPKKRRLLKQISGWFCPLALAEASCLASKGTMDYWFSFLTSSIILWNYSKIMKFLNFGFLCSTPAGSNH